MESTKMQTWSNENIEEFKKCRDDVAYFIENYVKLYTADEGEIVVDLYDYQKDIIELWGSDKFVIMEGVRQSRKTSLVIGRLVHFITFNSYKVAGVLGDRWCNARDILDKVKRSYMQLSDFFRCKATTWNKSNIELENGCVVITDTVSFSSFQGTTIHLLVIDEFAYVDNHKAAVFMHEVFPRFYNDDNIEIFINSTRNGTNHFYKLWSDAIAGRNKFAAYEVSWDDIPG